MDGRVRSLALADDLARSYGLRPVCRRYRIRARGFAMRESDSHRGLRRCCEKRIARTKHGHDGDVCVGIHGDSVPGVIVCRTRGNVAATVLVLVGLGTAWYGLRLL